MTDTGAIVLLAFVPIFFAELYLGSHGGITLSGFLAALLWTLVVVRVTGNDPTLSAPFLISILGATVVCVLVIGIFALKSRKIFYAGLTQFGEFDCKVDLVSPDGQSGKVKVRGELWDFDLFDPHKRVHVGDDVFVVRRRGLKLIVDTTPKARSQF